MKDYYIDNLSGNHLHQVYQLADDAVANYLQGEIDYFLSLIKPGYRVLELGCGYGRILKAIATDSHTTVGVDNAPGNAELAQDYLRDAPGTEVHLMSVENLDFPDQYFDLVLCPQNGLSAFGLEPIVVVREALRVAKSGGSLLCCTYAANFWPSRVHWFHRQAEAGLLAPIDEDATGDGVIACTDGFVSSAMSESEFHRIADEVGGEVVIDELASGSLVARFSRTPKNA